MENVRARAKRLWDNYGCTIEEWDCVNEYQKGVCWLCSRAERTGKRLSTDHSHLDGQFRGQLCSQCNPLLGKLENAFIRLGMHKAPNVTLIKVVERLASYLKSPPATAALGKQVFGYPGRTGTAVHRKWLKKRKKLMILSTPLLPKKTEGK